MNQREERIFPVEYKLPLEIKIIDPFSWDKVEEAFPTAEVVDVAGQNWSESETQLDDRADHTTYVTQTGQLVHWKERDGVYEPFYECVAYELSKEIGLAIPPTTAAFNTTTQGIVLFGTVSQVVFTTTLSDLTEDQKSIFFKLCNPALFAGETVVSIFWRNPDWSDRPSHVALGNFGGNSYQYYVFDRSHIFLGPRGDLPIEQLEDFDPKSAFWSHGQVNINLQDCLPYVNKIEQINGDKIRQVCLRVANKLGQVDRENSKLYGEMTDRFSDWLIKSKHILRRELKIFFSGMSYALA